MGIGATLIALSLTAMWQGEEQIQGATVVPPSEFERKIYLPGDSGRVYFEYNPVRVSEGAVPEASSSADETDGAMEEAHQPSSPEPTSTEPQVTGSLNPAAAPATTTAANKPIARKNLRRRHDTALQTALNRMIDDLDLDEAAADRRLGVSLVDITNPDNPRVASVNGDLMLYAASLPKIAILLAAFERIEQGQLRYDNELRNQLTAMIRKSSNSAATEVLDRVGRSYVNRLLASDRYRLYDRRHNGGLWVGKAYAKGSAYQRDPLHNISHGATAMQVARFYYLLETGQLVSKSASREMKRIMAHPEVEHKFVGGLMAARRGATLYRKSGTWGEYHSDSAIVEHAGRRYIAVALAQDNDAEDWLRNLIVAMDDTILQQAAPVQLAGL